jgi:hypothetical protein
MIRLRYTPPLDLELEGTSLELNTIGSLLAHLDSEQGHAEIACNTAFEPAPYSVALARIVFDVADGPIIISVSLNTMYLKGSATNFGILATYFDFDRHSNAGEHRHFEHYDGAGHIGVRSVPLVIACSDE